ncbi:MAG: S9 family peptidase [Pseudomonadota bacterium]|nr:S9 family peptidase [Pseudomonadota bacterium]
MRLVTAGLLLAAVATTAFAEAPATPKPHTLDELLRKWEIIDAKLSPNGDYLAVTLPGKDEKVVLGIFPIASPKDIHVIGMRERGEMVDEFEWVSSERVVLSLAKQVGGSQLEPLSTGELWAVNADGSHFKVLHSWRGEQQTGTRLNKTQSQSTFAMLLDTLPNDDDNILIYTTPIESGKDGAYSTVFRLNVNNGSRSSLGRAPMRNADFLVDSKGQARVAYGQDNELRSKIYARTGNGEEWKLVVDQATDGQHSRPISFVGDSESIYVQRTEKTGPDVVYSLSLTNGKWTEVIRDAVSDPLETYVTIDGGNLYGALFDAGTPGVRTFGDSAEATLLASLQIAFKGSLVEIVNFSRDGNYALLRVTSSSNPGDFYRFDRRKKKAAYLASRGQWLDIDQLASKREVTLKARDGTPLHGYLTVPQGKDAKNLPLVVWVHGGPHGVRDTGDYDPDAQVLAFGGYAVLQLNYRGSGGYGRALLTAGYRQWGAQMQDDLTDATRWAIEQGIADPTRICIGGASYGGYAAMMGVVREPKLYQCAISYVGVHDLRMMHTRGDINDSSYGESYLKEALGEDMDALLQRSPVAHAEKIEAAVFIAAGAMDERVPLAHAKAMSSALEKVGKKPVYMVKLREGHGYYDPENRLELYSGMLKFLDQHIGAQ